LIIVLVWSSSPLVMRRRVQLEQLYQKYRSAGRQAGAKLLNANGALDVAVTAPLDSPNIIQVMTS
jgi:hypothetical protein